jgi:hypothetical protein
MKVSIFVLVVVIAVTTANAQYPVRAFVPNPLLPYGAVELSPREAVRTGAFLQSKPDKRPDNVPSGHVLVSVWQRGNSERKFNDDSSPIPVPYLRFVEWTFMEANMVNDLHRRRETI